MGEPHITTVNDPGVVAEVAAAFARYESALAANDHAQLDEWFWDSPGTVRYGVDEEQYGAAAIAAWRPGSPVVPAQRRVGPTVITAFGDSCATVSTEFDNGDGSPRGRQSQTWVRFAEGWRIASAHVSLPARAYS